MGRDDVHIVKRIDMDGVQTRDCRCGVNCPAILEMDNGDICVIGEDITNLFKRSDTLKTMFSNSEKVVRIPRTVIKNAKDEI